MRYIIKNLLFGFAFIISLTLVFISVFAFQIGLDNNPQMGEQRIVLCIAGIFLLALTGWLTYKSQKILSGRANAAIFPDKSSGNSDTPETELCFQEYSNKKTGTAILFSVIITLAIAWWFMTGGKFNHITPYSHYMDYQAQGFLQGKLSLSILPPEALSALSDPYDWRAREEIDYLWDASYYQGKYYYYWGPFPSLITAGIKLFFTGVVEDQIICFIFYSLLIAAFAGVLFHIKTFYFKNTPWWIIPAAIFCLGFSTPVFWLINRPSIYEATIAAGQALFMLALFGFVHSLSSQKKTCHWLALTGISLGCSMASRFSNSIAVFGLAGMITFMILKRASSLQKKSKEIASLLLPILSVLLAVFWFNYARFGNILETGISYQLTGDALPDNPALTYSFLYGIPNLYLNLFHPLTIDPQSFPFLFTPFLKESIWPNRISLPPAYYYTEPTTGLLLTIPFLYTLILPVSGMAHHFWKWLHYETCPAWLSKDVSSIVNIITTGFFLLFIPMQLFVMSTMRYQADYLPALILLTATLNLSWITRSGHKKWLQQTGLIFIAFTCFLTAIIGILISFQSSDHRFEIINPALFHMLVTFFGGY